MAFVFNVYLYSKYEAQDEDDNVAKRQEWITKSCVIPAHVQSRKPQLAAPNAVPTVKYSQCSSGVNHLFKNLEAASNFEAPKWQHEAKFHTVDPQILGAIVQNLDVRNLCTPRLVPYDPAQTGRKLYHWISCGRP